jgi:NCAIR mutase (PurE)-related protein
MAAISSASGPTGAVPCSFTADLELPEFQIDWDRERRTGVPEAILCEGKTPSQIDAIIGASVGRRLLLTRLSADVHRALAPDTRELLDYDPLSRTAVLGEPIALADSGIGIVAAGTSDLPVAREAARTLAFSGHRAEIIVDVGVAGLWRLIDRLDALRQCRVLIAVAGMEGALFSVLAGLVRVLVIAVPTSVGYGVAEGGKAALHAALASCAPGLVVVNIDNGFGAAAAALKMLGAESLASRNL